MRRLLPILLLSPLCALAAPPAIDPPPPMPPAQATSSADEPEVRIIEQKNATITEYRSNGRLYKIKVQPKIGPAYYLHLVYLAISRKLVDGAPANSISTVPVMPWAGR